MKKSNRVGMLVFFVICNFFTSSFVSFSLFCSSNQIYLVQIISFSDRDYKSDQFTLRKLAEHVLIETSSRKV